MPVRAMLAALDGFAMARPLAFAMLFGGGKNITADLIIQTQFEGRKLTKDVNWRRTCVFGAFGLMYVGGAQYGIFNHLLPSLSWIGRGLLKGERAAAFKAVAFDQIVHMPFMYFPTFYAFRELGYGDKSIEKAMKDWKACVIDDMALQMSVFVPVQTLNFTIVPPRYRVPIIATFGFFYVMILSHTRGKIEDKDE